MEKKTRQLKIFLKLTPEEYTKIKQKAKLVDKTITSLAKYLLLNTNVEIKIAS